MPCMIVSRQGARPAVRAALAQRPRPPVVLERPAHALVELHAWAPSPSTRRAREVSNAESDGEEIHPPPVDRRIQLERLADVLDHRRRGQHRRQRQPAAEAPAPRGPADLLDQLAQGAGPRPRHDHRLTDRLRPLARREEGRHDVVHVDHVPPAPRRRRRAGTAPRSRPGTA